MDLGTLATIVIAILAQAVIVAGAVIAAYVKLATGLSTIRAEIAHLDGHRKVQAGDVASLSERVTGISRKVERHDAQIEHLQQRSRAAGISRGD